MHTVIRHPVCPVSRVLTNILRNIYAKHYIYPFFTKVIHNIILVTCLDTMYHLLSHSLLPNPIKKHKQRARLNPTLSCLFASI